MSIVLCLLQIFSCMSLELIKCIIFTYISGKVIIDLRKLLFSYFVQLAVENSVLASKICSAVIFRECNVNVKFFSGFLSYDLFFESRNEHSRSELEILLLSCSALELLFSDESRIVKVYGISILGFSLDYYVSRVSLSERLDLIIYLFICNVFLDLVDLKSLVVLDIKYR